MGFRKPDRQEMGKPVSKRHVAVSQYALTDPNNTETTAALHRIDR